MDIYILPNASGNVKIWVYGYQRKGDFGRVVAVYGRAVVTAKGYNRKRTIIKAVSKLNQLLSDQQKGL